MLYKDSKIIDTNALIQIIGRINRTHINYEECTNYFKAPMQPKTYNNVIKMVKNKKYGSVLDIYLY